MAPFQGGWGGSQKQHFGGGGSSKRESWYDTVKVDRSVSERPKWNLTSYAYQREKQNDVVGDISPEEVRYANMLSLQQGVPVGALKDEFRKATRDRVDIFQGLTRRRQAPSIEGRPITSRMDVIQNLSWVAQGHSGQTLAFGQTSSSGFGQSSGSTSPFGQKDQQQALFGGGGSGGGFGGGFGQSPMQPSSGFGQPSSTNASPFGQGNQQQRPFGSTGAAAGGGSSGFGGVFGQTKGQPPSLAFGQSSSTSTSPFGQGNQQQNSFGSEAAAVMGTSSGFGGPFGQTKGHPSSGFGQPSSTNTPPFGQANQQQQPFGSTAAVVGGGFGGGFGQASMQPLSGFGQPSRAPPFGHPSHGVPNNTGNATPGTQSLQTPEDNKPLSDEEKAMWMTQAFERKRIPTSAPPPHVC